MEKKFENVGLGYMASSKRSLKFEYRDPYSVLIDIFYASIPEIEKACKDPKKTFKLWKRTGEEHNESCEVHTE